MQCSSATQLTEQLESSDLNITLLQKMKDNDSRCPDNVPSVQYLCSSDEGEHLSPSKDINHQNAFFKPNVQQSFQKQTHGDLQPPTKSPCSILLSFLPRIQQQTSKYGSVTQPQQVFLPFHVPQAQPAYHLQYQKMITTWRQFHLDVHISDNKDNFLHFKNITIKMSILLQVKNLKTYPLKWHH